MHRVYGFAGMVLAAAAVLCFVFSTFPSLGYAQQGNTRPLTPSQEGQIRGVLTQVHNGQFNGDLSQAAREIYTATGGAGNVGAINSAVLNVAGRNVQGITGGTASNLDNMNALSGMTPNTGNFGNVTGLFSGGMDSQNRISALTGVISENAAERIPDPLALALTDVEGLGNLDMGQIGQLLQNPQIQQAIGGMISNAIGDVAGSLGGDPSNALGGQSLENIQTALQGGDLGAISGLLGGSGAENLIGQAGADALSDGIVATAAAGLAGGDVEQAASQLAGQAAAELLAQALPEEMADILGGALGGLLGSLMGSASQLAGAIPSSADANSDLSCPQIPCESCCGCKQPITDNHDRIRAHVTAEFEKHRQWLVTTYFIENILPAMMLMTEQLTAIGMQQVQIIGAFLDAKHQLETQQLFQRLTAEAHKDYHPSEGLCEVGTSTTSLAASERKSDLGQVVFAKRMLERQLLSGDVVSKEGPDSDLKSRLHNFIDNYCDTSDNGNGLELLCDNSAPAERRNKDVNYTRLVDAELTLDLDFTDTTSTPDEQDVFALSANLYGHEVPPQIPSNLLADSSGNPREAGYPLYLDLRSIAAKRSVAQNSFAAITALKSSGTVEAQPYLYKIVEELGVPEDDLEDLLGEKPSYFAQMEILTKKIYQNPVFYTELYDKPVNVERKGAALQAIALMQDRDLYRSLLRSEAILSVLLETMLMDEQEAVANEIGELSAQGDQL